MQTNEKEAYRSNWIGNVETERQGVSEVSIGFSNSATKLQYI
jgi:hypothetical protein